RPLPAGGRLPRPQGAAGLGAVPGVDAPADRAGHAGLVGGADGFAAAAAGAATAPGGRLVAAPAVGPAQEPPQRVGRGAAVAAGAAGGDCALPGGVAGQRGKSRGGRQPAESYVRPGEAPGGRKRVPTTRGTAPPAARRRGRCLPTRRRVHSHVSRETTA